MIYPTLRWAVQSGTLAEVKAHLERGADPNEIDSSSTPLSIACFHGKTGAVRALIAAGASHAVKHPRDDFPLVSAVRGKAKGKKAEIVKLLLDAGADPDPPVGTTTLIAWCAGKKELDDVVGLLVAAKKTAAPATKTSAAKPASAKSVPAKPAATPKATKPAATPKAKKLTATSKPATPAPPVESSTLKKPRGSKHRTIREAAQFGSTADVQLFLDAGWPADAVDTSLSFSSSALGMACFHRKPAIVRQLLAAGADPNLTCGASSPLLNAVASGSKRTLEMVQMLLDAGANPKTEGYRDMSLVAWVGRDPKLADVHAALVAALKSRA